MNAARALMALALALHLGAATAGQTCENEAPKAENVQRSLVLAQHVAQSLTASGDRVVVLARIGQDLSAYHQRYSHVGFAYREGDVWRVVHKLNHCGTSESALYRQGLGEFFLDSPHEYEAGIVALAPDVQARLLPLLTDNARLTRLHTPAYNMLAYPWSQRYQQSNQWAIETLALSEDPAVTQRAQAQAWLRQKGYAPATLRISALKRLGARATKANVAFDDHPDAQRFDGRIETVTADSVFQWLSRSGLGSRPVVIR